jgi:Fe2+ transport system protein FeoA
MKARIMSQSPPKSWYQRLRREVVASLLSGLAALGFTPGARLRVMQNFGHSPVIVSVRDTRVALDRGEATKIRVERLVGGEDGFRS